MAAGMYISDCSSSYLHEIREENWPIELHLLPCQCHNLVSSPPSLWQWPWYSIRVCQSIFLYLETSHVELHVPHEHKTSSILVHCQGPFCTPDAPAIKTKDPPHLYFCVKLKFWWIWTLCNKRLDNLWCLQPITRLFQWLCGGNVCPLCSSSSSCSSSCMVSIFADVLVVGAEVISCDLDITLVL
jgi:hypothetical protein